MIQIFLAFCVVFSSPDSLQLHTEEGSEWLTIVLKDGRVTDFISKIASVLVGGYKIKIDTGSGTEILESGAEEWNILQQIELMEGKITGTIIFEETLHVRLHKKDIDEDELKELLKDLEAIFQEAEGPDDYVREVKKVFGGKVLLQGFANKLVAHDFMSNQLVAEYC